MSTAQQTPPHRGASGRGRAAIARLIWFFFGPMALTFLAFAIINAGTGWTTSLDAIFLVVTILMLSARWYELQSGHGQDGYGNPTTLAAFPKYAWRLVAIALAAWVAANAVGNHLL